MLIGYACNLKKKNIKSKLTSKITQECERELNVFEDKNYIDASTKEKFTMNLRLYMYINTLNQL